MSEPSKDTGLSFFPVEITELDDADLIECDRTFFNRHKTGEPCKSETGEFAHAIMVEMKRRGLETNNHDSLE